MKTKQCYRCKEIKSTDEFSINNTNTSDGLISYCKNCCGKMAWEHHLHHNYNLTVRQYEMMLKSQNEVCAICERPETRKQGNKIRQLAVDHRHVPFKIRGLLCTRCNQILGQVKDDPEILEKQPNI